MGEEMTHNAKVMRSIPLRAEFSKYGIAKVELRGEALIKKDTFDKINKQREADGQPLFANPRNAATGGLRTKDSKETKARGLPPRPRLAQRFASWLPLRISCSLMALRLLR